ncbi:hypothetical protein CDD81_576 [Ophiocordyceps australis]|uniref:Uncharacterized protein n=1 Tax=Ophiocordyceps australis TaxID=1399860 RepID=A0A2C5YGN3_9HYPO|nr:hypothetical protein CDD81_576 [Ophiocordyceps australis]
MADLDNGPHIVRPIARRPFGLSLDSGTGCDGGCPHEQNSQTPPSPLQQESLLAPPLETLSRPQSILNLTSSTLMGIYSQAAAANPPSRDELVTDTPWGTGAQTPVRRSGIDDATYQLMRDRAHSRRQRRRATSTPGTRAGLGPSALDTASSLALLFVLGCGYGALVGTLHGDEQQEAQLGGYYIRPGLNWRYLTFWGAAGALLGSSLPWLDRVWERALGDEADLYASAKESDLGTDWTLVMRAVGAFVGIVFAIRKLAWASTLQVSATLALVNPLLWWLIDRSKPGLVLSAVVGLAGSMLLLGVCPQMMPAPTRSPMASPMSASPSPSAIVAPTNGSSPEAPPGQGPSWTMLGGLASQETLERGVWIVSVLFCSCICFGNIGRRLAWRRGASGKGRWGWVR